MIPLNGVRNVWALIHIYWWSEEKISARLLLFSVVALTLGMVYLNVQINEWQNHFFNSLQDRNASQFYHQLLRFVGLAAIWVIMSVYTQYFTQMLQIRWRLGSRTAISGSGFPIEPITACNSRGRRPTIQTNALQKT